MYCIFRYIRVSKFLAQVHMRPKAHPVCLKAQRFVVILSAHVTPRHGSAPAHRAGREPGTPAREAGALTRNAKGYSL